MLPYRPTTDESLLLMDRGDIGGAGRDVRSIVRGAKSVAFFVCGGSPPGVRFLLLCQQFEVPVWRTG